MTISPYFQNWPLNQVALLALLVFCLTFSLMCWIVSRRDGIRASLRRTRLALRIPRVFVKPSIWIEEPQPLRAPQLEYSARRLEDARVVSITSYRKQG